MRKTQNNKELVGELTESEIEFGKLLKKIKRMRKQDVKEVIRGIYYCTTL